MLTSTRKNNARKPRFWRLVAVIITFTFVMTSFGPGVTRAADDTIKVGILHSLSGTMSISEVSVKDATLMAIEEINASGGVMGKKLEVVVEDGASDWPTFAEKAKKLIQQD